MKKTNSIVLLFLILFLAILAGLFAYQPFWTKTVAQFHLPGFFNRDWHLGLDLVGGSLLTYEIDLKQAPATERDSVVKGLRDVIEKRVNLFGVSEPQVYATESGELRRLVVELAGIKDVNQAIKTIGETPLLDFREVVKTQVDAAPKSEALLNGENNESAEQDSIQFVPTILTGRFVKNAQLGFDSLGKPVVNIGFNDEGAKIFENLTEKNVGRPLAIFLDNELIEIPTVREKISGGHAQISGNFTPESARLLVERFNAGALPAPINLISQQTIGASLGLDFLKKAIFSGYIAFVLVAGFMLIFYREFGLVSAASLSVYAVLTLAVFKFIPITMTLAGIAGFILSIGMAVDANVLVFARIKEELQRGLSKRAAMEEGFRRAWPSVRDSNATTIIISVILFYFTTSFIKGFALTLFIGILISMFAAITVSRIILRSFLGSETK